MLKMFLAAVEGGNTQAAAELDAVRMEDKGGLEGTNQGELQASWGTLYRVWKAGGSPIKNSLYIADYYAK